jgi:DNA-binding NtrC family response regulator
MSAMESVSVLVAEADPRLGDEIQDFLEARGYSVERALHGEEAFNRLDRRRYAVLVSALHLPRGTGIRLMKAAQDRNPEICVIVIAAKGETQEATDTLRQGAYDFQSKPLNLPKLEAVIERGLRDQRHALERVELRRRLDERFGLGSLSGQSRQMMQVYSAVRQIGPTEEPVLIHGEPGTGKARIAQAIHHGSPRRDGPFVQADCARFTEPITRAELFGRAADAGDGIARSQSGYFMLADSGTLFLDGMTACTRSLQEEVLQVLQEGRVRREGDGKSIRVDVRLIIAMERRPYAAGHDPGRMPLFDALLPAMIEAPALRERPGDIPALIGECLQRANEKHGKQVPGCTRNALNVLIAYPWPGNVRELDNLMDGLCATASDNAPLGLRDLPVHIRGGAHGADAEIRIPAGAAMREIERTAIEETMKRCNFNKEACAKMLGIGLRTLYRKLDAYETR